jgi:hypothetical protein
VTTPQPDLDPAGPARVISIKAEQAHGHLRVHVWIGQDGHPGKVGELLMRPEDWFDLDYVLGFFRAFCTSQAPKIQIRYEPGTQQWLDSHRPQPRPRAEAGES